MKKLVSITLLAASLASAGNALAGDTATLAISATVTGSCKFTTASFAMSFGTLDPAAAADVNRTTDLTYKCTKGTLASSFTFNDTVAPASSTSPATVSITNSTDNIPVKLTWSPASATPSPTGTGFGAGSSVITMTVTGDILGTDYASVSAGAYSRNVSVVIAP